MDIKLIYQSIDKEMAEVEARLGGMFTDCQHGQIVEIGQFLMSSPGKRLRPAMVILSARACSLSGGYVIDDEELAATATAVELIHTASLIHDDIVDRASMRHNRQSINSRWGDDVSLIFGDYIYTKAFNILSSSRKEGVLACLSDAIHTMCEGELRQILQRDAADMSEVSYEAIIEKKTASLFAACCEIGSVLGSQSGEVQVAMRE
ncbi:MAG: polyprenyl synthetase family protein, partial [Anaerohalosphaera sp.]|nr:polyprenyl synthetase family protein [Anaerohalosphaera sp.]